MFTALVALSTASVYYAQSVKDTLSKENSIDEVVLSGVADLAKDRKTPVAVSNIREAQIVEKLGNQEFPEILNTTPSVYAVKGGGGFGDAKLNIRGFSQENIAVLINGVPVNDMENGSVFWSNWAGLSDVTSLLQVQRGLGSSKLAIASVGGTVNIITRAADRKESGKVSLDFGNDGYYKSAFSYNSGKSAKGWSTSFLLARTAGSTYANGTDFEAYNYYFALGYQPNEKHDIQFTMTGAPQYHNQRAFEIKLQTLINRGSYDNPDRRYNEQEGRLNGEEYTFRRNYYHKPVLSINWDWKIAPNSKLSTVAYGSFGRGAGTGDLSGTGGKRASDPSFQTADGLVNFDAIVAYNQSTTPDKALIRRASINSHNWYGLITSFNQKINDNFNFTVGFDGRYYYGYHYQVVSDLLGAQSYRDGGLATSNKNLYAPNAQNVFQPGYNFVSNTTNARPDFNPFGGKIDDIQDQIGYSNDGQVLWYGGFAQAEYSNDVISAFVSGAVSNQGFQRIDNFILDGKSLLNGQVAGYATSATNQTLIQPTATNPALNTKTGYKNLVGYNAKAGINVNVSESSNVFGNIGYYSKQPFLNSVYPNQKNFLNPNLTNEKIFGLELGYGFRTSWLEATVNAYRTTWSDRFQRQTANITLPNNTTIRGFANIQGIEEIHQGFEFEGRSRINDFATVTGSFSIGDWHYRGNATGSVFDETNQPLDAQGNVVADGLALQSTLFLDDVKVGNSAQTTASAGLELTPVKGIKLDASYRWVQKLYANLNISDFTTAGKSALELPSFGLIDAGVSFKIPLNNPKQSFTLRGNIYNVFDTVYISQAFTNIKTTDAIATTANAPTYEQAGQVYDGLATGNQVFFGFGRTFSTSVAFNF